MIRAYLLSFIMVLSMTVANKASLYVVQNQHVDTSALMQERKLFTDYWVAQYENYSLHQLGTLDVLSYVSGLFDSQIDQLQNSLHMYCFNLYDQDHLIGWIVFERQEDEAVFVRSWALSDTYMDMQMVDLLKELLFLPLEYIDVVSSIRGPLRRLQDHHIALLEQIGFAESLDDSVSLDRDIYSIMQVDITDKCGTCMCDYDDEDFDELYDHSNVSKVDQHAPLQGDDLLSGESDNDHEGSFVL